MSSPDRAISEGKNLVGANEPYMDTHHDAMHIYSSSHFSLSLFSLLYLWQQLSRFHSAHEQVDHDDTSTSSQLDFERPQDKAIAEGSLLVCISPRVI